MKVVIVGAGIIGLNCAYYLHKKGIEVSVLDQGEVCSGASAGNACYVAPSHIVPLPTPDILAKGLKWMFNPKSPFYIKPRPSIDLISWLLRFCLNCNATQMQRGIPVLNQLLSTNLKLLLEMSQEGEFEFPLWKKGLFYLFITQKGMTGAEKLSRVCHEHGVTSSLVNQRDLEKLDSNLVSDSVLGSLYFPNDVHIDSQAFVLALANYLKSQGVEIQTRTPIQSVQPLSKASNQVALFKDSGESVQADAFVIANGAWAPKLLDPLGIKTHIQPAKGYSLTFPAPDNLPSSPAILAESKVAMTPLGDRLRFSGTLELAGYDRSINPVRVQAIVEAANRYLPHLNPPENAIKDAWAGYRSCTPTGLPLIGKTNQYENLFIATGHNMIGISLANVTGQLIQEAICGEKPFYHSV